MSPTADSATTATPFHVTVHTFPVSTTSSKPAIAYEHGVRPAIATSSAASNALVFIGGLGDGPHGVPYVRAVADVLSRSSLNCSVFEITLSSAASGWGYGSLATDVDEIAALVAYLRKTLGKRVVVLMGHSTGCQDCVAYLRRLGGGGGGVPEVDGVILQGPVSDREAIGMVMSEAEMRESVEVARSMIEQGREHDFMSKEKVPEDMRDSPITAYRWFSLASNGGDDDFFSSDLSDAQLSSIWSGLSKPVLVLPSAQDEHVPTTVDVAKLMGRWKGFCRPGVYHELSGLILGANHRVDNPSSQDWLAKRVVQFLSEVQFGIVIGELGDEVSNANKRKRSAESVRGVVGG